MGRVSRLMEFQHLALRIQSVRRGRVLLVHRDRRRRRTCGYPEFARNGLPVVNSRTLRQQLQATQSQLHPRPLIRRCSLPPDLSASKMTIKTCTSLSEQRNLSSNMLRAKSQYLSSQLFYIRSKTMHCTLASTERRYLVLDDSEQETICQP